MSDDPEQRHPTTPVVIDGESADIDVEIAPLVSALNAIGLDTYWSCQGDEGERASIGFVGVEDAAAFVAIVGRDFDQDLESLWNRALRDGEPEDDWERFRAERMWEYNASPRDYSVTRGDDGELHRKGDCAVGFDASVHFPRGDIAAVTALVQAAR
jgi:hypothetical protein